MNPGTFAVLAVLIIIVGLIFYKMIKDRKSGKSSCSCGGSCSGCGMAGSCHKPQSGKSSDTSGDNSIVVEDQNVIKKITLQIDGMMCGMCESHINDAIRSNLNVKKLTPKGIMMLKVCQLVCSPILSKRLAKDSMKKLKYLK